MRRRLCEKASMGRLQELLSELTINFNRNHMMEPTHIPRHPSSFLNCVTILYREAVRKKYGIIWEFSTNGGPPPFSFFLDFAGMIEWWKERKIKTPNNGNIRAFSPNIASRQYALLEKRPQ